MQYRSKKAFTLIEMIFVVVISSVLATGTFKAIEALYIRSSKAKAVTDLSMQSQIVLDQLSVFLYNRIPNSVIGYDGDGTVNCVPIDEATGSTYKVLQWLSLDDEQLNDSNYTGFVDMNASIRPNLSALGVEGTLNIADRNLIFAGAFDGGTNDKKACNGAYGWHGALSDLSHAIASVTTDTIKLSDIPDEIYEKYYLTNGAYGVARGEDINLNASCITSLNHTVDENTLFLFYNYQPYQGDTYCADNGSNGNKDGNVTILAEDVVAFRASYENDIIRLSIDMNKSIRGSNSVHISKQKAVF